MSSKKCDNCGYALSSDKPSVVYCNYCFKERKLDICELIDHTGEHYFSSENVQEFEDYISKNGMIVRLDLHGVLDTIPQSVKFENSINICCVSFVGSTTKTRIEARREIKKRLGTQVDFGILVFSRGRDQNKNFFQEKGSKAWVNQLIPIPENKKAVFVDDSYDHYNSTKALNIKNLDCFLYGKNLSNLIDIIRSYNL